MPTFLFLPLHLLAAALWVGGMFFAYLALRPAAGALPPAERFPLWGRTFQKFFPWVWGFILVLPITGYTMALQRGFDQLGMHVHLMQGLGWLMIGLFLHAYFAPYRRLTACIAQQDWAAAAQQLARLRRLVGINLVLGLLTIILGASGRYW